MARARIPEHAPTPPNGFVASATSLPAMSTFGAGRPGEWQGQAWKAYSEIGELRFVASWVGNVMSRARLVAAVKEGRYLVPLDDGPVAEVLDAYFGGQQGQGDMFQQTGVHLGVAGEAYHLATETDRGVEWDVLATGKVQQTGSGDRVRITADRGDGKRTQIGPHDLPIRIWTPHPQNPMEADSPVRANLSTLGEIRALNDHVQAQLTSRLAGAGILFVPSEITFPAPPGADPASSQADSLTLVLGQAMMTPIQDRSNASAVVPIVITAPGEMLDKVQHLTFWTPLDEVSIAMREAAVKKLAIGLDTPPEVLLGLGDGSHWNCVDDKTEILTVNGWVSHETLRVGDVVLGLDHETGQSRWVPVQAVNRHDVVDAPMVRLDGRRHSSLTTENHRWPTLSGHNEARVRAWSTSGEMAARLSGQPHNKQQYEYIVCAAINQDVPLEAKHSDEFVELVAWFYTEGSAMQRAGRTAPQVAIHQSRIANPINCARIERVLTALYGPQAALGGGGRGKAVSKAPHWRRCEKKNGMNEYRLNGAAAAPLWSVAPGRLVDLSFVRDLTLSQLRLFIDVSVDADGFRQGQTCGLIQKHPEMLDAFEMAATLAGKNARRSVMDGMGIGKDGPKRRIVHVCTLGSHRSTLFAPKAKAVTQETYTGVVWCPTTELGTWFARREGATYYTGNSWLVEESAIKAHIEPRLAVVVRAITDSYLRPALEGLVPNPEDFYVLADTSQIRMRPNRSKEAIELYDRGVLSAQAVLRETGFDPSDAPKAVEEREWLLRRIATGSTSPEQTQAALGLLGADLGIESSGTNTITPDHMKPTRTLEGHPDQGPPSLTDAKARKTQRESKTSPPNNMSALLAASEGALLRALERAGNRLCDSKARANGVGEIPAHARYLTIKGNPDALLAGAWEFAPTLLEGLTDDPQEVVGVLDFYARGLLTTQRPHNRRTLQMLLEHIPARLA